MIPITSVATMRESDAATIRGGVPGGELMARAGHGIFESYPWHGPVAIVCGSGNNAGDGYVLALELFRAKIPCTLVLLAPRWSVDGGEYYRQCKACGIPDVLYTEEFSFSPFSEIADCIFGTGFSGEVEGFAAQAIKAINQSGAAVISADINSGLNGDNGQGAIAVKSNLTVAIGAYKQGHFLGNAKDCIGALKCIDIGISVPDEGVYLLEASDAASVFQTRLQNSHKGNYGYVTLMGGCREYAGAVKLANMSAAALRAGCGVARLAVPEVIGGAVAPYLLESTLLTLPSDAFGKALYSEEHLSQVLAGQAAIAVGMGWGRSEQYARILSYLLEQGSIPLVIDADGLNTLATMDLACLKKTKCRVVLTPHLKEMERLSGIPIPEILKSPVAVAREFAKKHGVCLLLKGCTTVVTDGETTYLVNRGCAGMATAGSGDVLSGILAGLLGYIEPTPHSVACGAYLAGRAGELAEADTNPVSMVASDTVAHLPQAIAELL